MDGGSAPQLKEYSPFVECLEDCGLEDVRTRGRFITWSNGTIRSKIDRTLVNVKWIELFP